MKRKKYFSRIYIVFLFFYSFALHASEFDTLTVMTYNILNFNNNSDGYSRIDDFRIIIEDINPDILVVQELISRSGGELFLDSVMNCNSNEYRMSPFYDGYDTDNLLYYRDSVLGYLCTEQITTSLRNISAYTINLKNVDSNFSLLIYSAHLKAGNPYYDPTCEQRRYEEVLCLRDHVESLPSDTYYMVAGDFNLYSSDEPAYKVLMDSMVIDLFDPIGSPGNWHNNENFAWLHTQATRGGGFGGMDDRFDFILMSEQFEDSDVMHYVDGSYQSFGNDGNHFNKSINDGVNTAVSSDLANALYNASDHLPVVAKICYETSGSRYYDEPRVADELHLLTAYPNPFNGLINLKLFLPYDIEGNLSVYDISGRKVDIIESGKLKSGYYTKEWIPSVISSGVYIIRFESDEVFMKQKVLYIK